MILNSLKKLFQTVFNKPISYIKIINNKRKKRVISPQRVTIVENKKQHLNAIKAKKLNFKKLPTEKGFFGKKIEALVTICLLNGFILTPDFGPSDINKKFLENHINSGKLVDGHLQIKASKTNSFSTADLFYFLESPTLNLLLIKYKVDTRNKTFKIIKVYNVQLYFSFFEYIISNNEPFLKFLSEKEDPFRDVSKNFNEKKDKMAKKKLKFFSFSHKRTRWQGSLNITPLRKFLEENNEYGYVKEIKIDHSCSFSYCDVCIKPITLNY
jgi:hypothetical protein